MGKSTIYIMSVVVASLIMLSGCNTTSTGPTPNEGKPASSAPQPNQTEPKFKTSFEIHNDSGTVGVTYEFKNISTETQELTFPNGLRADCQLFNEKGELVFQHSENYSVTQALETESLAPNDFILTDFMISGLTNGKYKLVMFTTSNEEEGKIVTDVVVDNSIYHKVKGVFVGWIDNNMAEFIVDGEAKAFQFDEISREQINQVEENMEVSFTYSSTELEADTIINLELANK